MGLDPILHLLCGCPLNDVLNLEVVERAEEIAIRFLYTRRQVQKAPMRFPTACFREFV
jgi:hypothetical protein